MSETPVDLLEYSKSSGRGVPTRLVWLGLTLMVFFAGTVLLYGLTGLHNDNPFWGVWVGGAVIATVAALRLARPGEMPVVARFTWLVLAVLWGLGGVYLHGLFTGIDPHVLTRARNRCNDNLRQIGYFLQDYATAHGGRFPEGLEVLVAEGGAPAELFVTPFSEDAPATGPTTREVAAGVGAGGHCSYVYLGRGLTAANAAGMIVAYEPLSKHANNIKGIHVLYGNGVVAYFPEARAKRVIAELEAGRNPPVVGGW